MPMYEYHCLKCGHIPEKPYFMPINAPPPNCPVDRCGGKMARVVSSPAKTTVGKYGKGGGR